jgi:hypothetical protein
MEGMNFSQGDSMVRFPIIEKVPARAGVRIGAKGATEAAQKLERLGHENDLVKANEVYAKLKAEIDCIIPALATLTE